LARYGHGVGEIAGGGRTGDGPAQARLNGGAGRDGRDRVLTIPNGLSVLRLIGVPVFLWLVLGPHADYWAVALLIGSAATDWLDGKIARALNQQSRLGEALDPAADRLYIAATLIGLAVRGIIPWWLVAVLAVRELTVAGALGLLKRRMGFGTLQVSFAGKTATLCLLYAFPLLLLGAHAGTWHSVARVIGWAFAIWGTALYWWAAMLYLSQTRALLTGRLTPGPGEVPVPATGGDALETETIRAAGTGGARDTDDVDVGQGAFRRERRKR
jgi:cardiolipin synthase (CMP-forming)